MKKLLGFWIGIVIIVVGFLLYNFAKIRSDKKIISPAVQNVISTKVPRVSISQKAIFVPYWGVSKTLNTSEYDTAIYFGITPDTSGINKNEDGYKKLSLFTTYETSKRKLLTIRMLTPEINEKALHDAILQKNIITQSIQIAKENGFDGIVLDFEYSGIAFDPLVQSTTTLSKNFALEMHKNNLLFYQMLYGDSFYRVRPFDIEAIGKESDGIFIMAYGLHKVGGNAGPNFPLKDPDYDFSAMIPTFLEKVPAQKITVIFGMFGYDWKENDKGQSLGIATSHSLLEMQKKFIFSCQFTQCKVIRDQMATEYKVTYKDGDGFAHEVWFEDTLSIKAKEGFLQNEGIGSVGFWAYTYF